MDVLLDPKDVRATTAGTMDIDSEDGTQALLEERQILTRTLHQLPYDLITYLERAAVHSDLGYPDLAASDAYRALLLCDEIANESFEYHEQAVKTLQQRSANGLPSVLRYWNRHSDAVKQTAHIDVGKDDNPTAQIARIASMRCYHILGISLLLCGCLKSAYDFTGRGLAVAPHDEDLLQAREYVESMARRRLKVDEIDINDLPDQGLVRREVYPWNDHEPDRFSEETLAILNAELESLGSKCVVKATQLPVLLETASDTDSYEYIPTNIQLGLFAKEDIQPGEVILNEHSILAANNRLKDNLCDACSLEFPPLGENSTVVACPDCDDIMFCSSDCLQRAQSEYHPAVCDTDTDTIAKDPDPKEKPSALYLLLLSRAIAMSITQELHPLDLKEVKYIWGDFLRSEFNAVSLSVNAPPPPVWTLPFSFQYNISGPLHLLEKMDIDIFTSLDTYDLWIFNTLYAKFRGTASARVNPRNGHPEVAAVHPLWCLANHDCDPNVQWEWGGRMKLWCRERRVGGVPGGIRKGEEILNHYCDIDLKVKDRREWALGSLGGSCMCERCRREAAAEEEEREQAQSSSVNGYGHGHGHGNMNGDRSVNGHGNVNGHENLNGHENVNTNGHVNGFLDGN